MTDPLDPFQQETIGVFTETGEAFSLVNSIEIWITLQLFVHFANAKSLARAESFLFVFFLKGQASMIHSIVCSSPPAHSGLGLLLVNQGLGASPEPVEGLTPVSLGGRYQAVGSDTRCLFWTSLDLFPPKLIDCFSFPNESSGWDVT